MGAGITGGIRPSARGEEIRGERGFTAYSGFWRLFAYLFVVGILLLGCPFSLIKRSFNSLNGLLGDSFCSLFNYPLLLVLLLAGAG